MHISNYQCIDNTKTTCEQTWDILKSLYIANKQEDDRNKIVDELYSRPTFPNIIGTIDVRMIHPENFGSSYFTYKKMLSRTLIAWTDADSKFTYKDVSSYETVSNLQILKVSEMG